MLIVCNRRMANSEGRMRNSATLSPEIQMQVSLPRKIDTSYTSTMVVHGQSNHMDQRLGLKKIYQGTPDKYSTILERT